MGMPLHRVNITGKMLDCKILASPVPAAVKDRNWSQGSIMSCRAPKSVLNLMRGRNTVPKNSMRTDRQQNLTITAALVLS